MLTYPLVFGTRDAVTGNGFVAGVSIQGRALAVQEGGEWWVYGVEPGGLDASGETPVEPYLRFRETVRKVLLDSAALASDFEGFQADVTVLGSQKDEREDARWTAARAAVRAGDVAPEGAIAELPRVTDEVVCNVEVTRLDEGTELRADETSGPSFACAA
jgi:hypothetical protein